ncbi:hypothetical protein [Desulfitobacterium sp.]|uniref:hypothetical protein n=1 Tax=Desulfitobacterium sp. TaxID=49981 RepID=UPI002B1EDC3A|nr:hypothetical protein [Desulfitobacterium sp.]MEA4902657.1 hypothetical protein [Desulfitobacterium sp.]
MKQAIRYSIYSPCGNDTALVQGMNFSQTLMKRINDTIMKRHANVEQVGFIDTEGSPKLIMAGGEFCGNATRCAAYAYLNGKIGEIKIKVSGAKGVLRAGVDQAGNVWSQIPVYAANDAVTALQPGITKVKMEGITHILVEAERAKPYLEDKNKLKESAMKIIKQASVNEAEAVGVIFIEKMDQRLKINPVVWVRSIDTLFYETACGSGTVAIGILESLKQGSQQGSKRSLNQRLEVLQPSGQVISTAVSLKNGLVVDSIISGKVHTDGVLRAIEAENVKEKVRA